MFQSAEFLQKDPRVAFVRRMGLELPLAQAGGTVTVGGQDGPVTLADGVRAGLRQHSHLGYMAWHQVQGERFQRNDEVKQRSRGWLDCSGPQGGVTMMMRDMWQQFPNELLADRANGRLVAYFWPEDAPLDGRAPLLELPRTPRRASPPAATAATGSTDDWYPNDPFVGVSKTHELLLYFHGPQQAAGEHRRGVVGLPAPAAGLLRGAALRRHRRHARPSRSRATRPSRAWSRT